MRKFLSIIAVIVLVMSSVLTANAADGKVTYDGNARDFIFEPGGEHSLTDLFPNFKGVMPGDTLTQKITVKNEASNKVKVNVYIRSLGAHEDSVAFLSQLELIVGKSGDNAMAYMFDAAADKTAGLTDWVLLGTLYSGGVVNLDVTLNVPVELPNEFQNSVGKLDWEFMVEELPIEDTDPKPPKTGEDNTIIWLIAIMLVSVCLIVIILLREKKRNSK